MMNSPKHIAKNIVSETFDELGVEVPTELHENRRLKRFIEARQPFAVVDTSNDNEVVATASTEEGAKSIINTAELPPMRIKDKSKLKIVKTRKKQHIGHSLTELDEEAKYKKVKDLNPEQTLWMVGKEYFIISYSPYADETAVFRSDRNGRPKSMSDVWATKGYAEPDGIAKMLAKHAKDFEIKEQR